MFLSEVISIPTVRRASAVLALLCLCRSPLAESVRVRYQEGTQRGFLVLRDQAGAILASGDMIKVVHGVRVTVELLFHFRDGSVDDETSVYTQQKTFHLLTDHHVQRGPAYPHPVDYTIDVGSGRVAMRSIGGDGKQSSEEFHMDLTPDLANGMVVPILMNLNPKSGTVSVPYVAPLGKPRLIHLQISVAGHHPISVGRMRVVATDFLIKPEIGGLAGWIAPILGKQPADVHVWLVSGKAPAFLREQGQFYAEGPIWTIQQVMPSLPR